MCRAGWWHERDDEIYFPSQKHIRSRLLHYWVQHDQGKVMFASRPKMYVVGSLQVVAAVIGRRERPRIPSQAPQALAQLMMSCWSHDPDQRPCFDDVVPWLESS